GGELRQRPGGPMPRGRLTHKPRESPGESAETVVPDGACDLRDRERSGSQQARRTFDTAPVEVGARGLSECGGEPASEMRRGQQRDAGEALRGPRLRDVVVDRVPDAQQPTSGRLAATCRRAAVL